MGHWLDPQDVEAFRSGEDLPDAFFRIRRQCERYACKMHGHVEMEGVVSEGLVNCVPQLTSPNVSVEELQRELARALDRCRKRRSRRQARTVNLEWVDRAVEQVDPHGVLSEVTARVLERSSAKGRLALTPRDRRLVIEYYGFEQLDSMERPSCWIDDGESKRKAIYRARKRFLMLLRAEVSRRSRADRGSTGGELRALLARIEELLTGAREPRIVRARESAERGACHPRGAR